MIKKTHITEKANTQKGQSKQAFVVDKKINKSELKKLIEKTYKVDVVKINISRGTGVKKAIITLKPGQTINEKV